MVEVMCRFPKVENLIAVLDRSIEGCNAIRNEENIKRDIQRNVEWGRRRAG